MQQMLSLLWGGMPQPLTLSAVLVAATASALLCGAGAFSTDGFTYVYGAESLGVWPYLSREFFIVLAALLLVPAATGRRNWTWSTLLKSSGKDATHPRPVKDTKPPQPRLRDSAAAHPQPSARTAISQRPTWPQAARLRWLLRPGAPPQSAGAGGSMAGVQEGFLDGGRRRVAGVLRRSPWQADTEGAGFAAAPPAKGRSLRSPRALLVFPRISMELSPLPRLSLHFPGGGAGRQPARRSLDWRSPLGSAASACGSDPGGAAARQLGGAAHADEADWSEPLASPTLARARRFHARQAAGMTQSPTHPTHAAGGGGEAPASLGLDALPPDAAALARHVTEEHLLQFGAMLGEASSLEALSACGGAAPLNAPGSLYGHADVDAYGAGWEPIVTEAAPGVAYWGWRRPLRRGLHLYMTRTVFAGATPSQVRAFMLDDAAHRSWDDSTLALLPLAAAARGAGAPRHESDVLYSRVRFPKPMAQRDYVYARRVWGRPSDGGAYVLSRACERPAAAALPGPPAHAVAVEDYCAGYVVRSPTPGAVAACPAVAGVSADAPAAEVLLVYFEDSGVRPGLANLCIRKALWPLVLRTDRGLRAHLAAAAAPAPAPAPVAVLASAAAPEDPAAAEEEGAAAPVDKPGHGGGGADAQREDGGSPGVLGRAWELLSAPTKAVATAAVWLWRWQTAAAGLLPRLEWRLLSWVAANGRQPFAAVLLSAPAATGAGGGSGTRHAAVVVVPPPEGLPPLRTQRAHPATSAPDGNGGCPSVCGLRRLHSHPLEDDSCPDAASPCSSGSGASSSGGSGSTGPRVTRAAAACTRRPAQPSTAAEWPDAPFILEPVGSRDAAGRAAWNGERPFNAAEVAAVRRGERKRQLMLRLMQAAGVRLAHKVLSASGGWA